MKKQLNLKFLFASFLLMTLLTGILNAQPTSANDKTEISVPTIVCGKCVKNVTKALKKVDGVYEVKVDLDSKKASVSFDNTKTTVSDLENAITAAGYDANNKTADSNAYEKLDDCCKAK